MRIEEKDSTNYETQQYKKKNTRITENQNQKEKEGINHVDLTRMSE